MTRTRFTPAAFWTLAILGTVAVLASSLPYLVGGSAHPFLLERPQLSAQALWKLSLLLHIQSGMLCLPAGLLLLCPRAVARWPRLHRGLGRAYACAIFLVMFPTGIHLAAHAKFGWAAGTGFLLSDFVATYFTFTAVRAVTQRDMRRHRHDMLRGYAQVASAITFRIYHIAFQLAGLPYEQNYVTSLWLSVLGNAVIAEAVIARVSRATTSRNHHESHHVPGRLVAVDAR